MDLYCATCGEPWDFDCLHDEADRRHAPKFSDLSEEAKRSAGREFDPNAHPDYRAYRAEYDRVYQAVRSDFQTRGCEALGGQHSAPSQETDPVFSLTRQEAAGALYDLLGDDMDGAAAMLADMGF